MNIVLFDDRDFGSGSSPTGSSNQITVRDRRALHILNVLKLDVGSRVKVGRITNAENDLNLRPQNSIGVAKIVQVQRFEIDPRESVRTGVIPEVTLIIENLDQTPPPPSPVELILALPRPKSLKRCLRAIANLGVKSVHLIHSIRVDKSYWTAPALEPKVMHEALLEGLSIARDTVLPRVHLHRLFKPFAQDVAPHLVSGHAFVAHPTTENTIATLSDLSSFGSFPSGMRAARIPVAIGPEGGFSEYEVGLFNEAGFQNLSLGSRIYSVECAVPVLNAVLSLRQFAGISSQKTVKA